MGAGQQLLKVSYYTNIIDAERELLTENIRDERSREKRRARMSARSYRSEQRFGGWKKNLNIHADAGSGRLVIGALLSLCPATEGKVGLSAWNYEGPAAGAKAALLMLLLLLLLVLLLAAS